jgi:microcystin-dependent protein
MSRVLDLWAGMTGTILDFAGAAAPTGWLLCYGQAVSRTTYAPLFAAIGTTYGAGDGSTTFNLPDCRGRVHAGKDNMGGTAASRLTNSGTGNPGVDGSTLGATGGVDRVGLAAANLPAHAHTFKYATATFTSGAGVMPQTFGTGTSANTDTSGGNGTATGDAHSNAQPTLVLNKIVKT